MASLVVNISELPEVLASLRIELANALRAQADRESVPAVADRLRQVAAAFEAGQAGQADGR